MTNLKQQIWHWIKRWGRRFYLLVHPKESWRYLLYWSFTIPSQLAPLLLPAKQVWASCLVKGECVSRSMIDLSVSYGVLEQLSHPKISCLMVTRERLLLAQRAIECFRNQSYPNKELIIIDDDPDGQLKQWTNSLADESIVHVHLPDESKPLGELRNLSLSYASGEYVAQWDDDDISHPDRLLLQMGVMKALGTAVCFLHRQLFWFPERRCLGISDYSMAENTMVCEKQLLPSYAPLNKGEDTLVCSEIVRSAKTALCDQPDAYIYVFQGDNTWDVEHFEQIMNQNSHQYTGDNYVLKLRDLSSEYGINLSEMIGEEAPQDHALTQPTIDIDVLDSCPEILILTPVKNATQHIPRFTQNLARTRYPEKKISIGFLESDSEDGSYDMLKELLPTLQKKYARVSLYKQDFAYQIKNERWAISQQFKRRSILAQSRNMLLSQALRDEEWVMWIDVDLLSWRQDAFIRLLQSGKDIVVPHCIKENGDTFDLNTFKLSEDADTLDWQRYIIDGILQPPVGYGRHYLKHFSNEDYIELDGVGGTMLLIRADIHRKGLIFPAQAYRNYIETEGLAQMARDMGYICWGMPKIEVVHGDH